MGFFPELDAKQARKTRRPADLTALIYEQCATLNTKRLPRDVSTCDRSSFCLDVVNALPAKARARVDALPFDVCRQPYLAHTAYAGYRKARLFGDLPPHIKERGYNPYHALNPELVDTCPTFKRLRASLPGDLEATVRWFQAEEVARRACFGTMGWVPMTRFCKEIIAIRAAIRSSVQPDPDHWHEHLCAMLEAGLLYPIGWIGAKKGPHLRYPSYKVVFDHA